MSFSHICRFVFPQRWRRAIGFDVVAAALGAIFLIGGLTDVRVAWSVGVYLFETNTEIGGIALFILCYFPFVLLCALYGAPIICLHRARSIAGGCVAVVIAHTTVVAGAYMMFVRSGPDPEEYWLVILPYPGYVVTQYTNSQWGVLVTIVQIVLGVVLLNFFRRPRPVHGTTGKRLVPEAPNTPGDGEHER